MFKSGMLAPRALRAAGVLALLAMAAAAPSRAQNNFFFQSTPTTNSCAGWILWPGNNCPAAMLGTQVLTCRLYQITGNTAGGVFVYAPAASAVFPPGYVCSFHTCAPAALQMTCMTFGFTNDKASIKDEIKVTFNRQTQPPKATVSAPAEP